MHLYLDGELPLSQVPELLEHLKSCESCRALFEELRGMTFEIRNLPDEAPEGLHAKIMETVEKRRKASGFKKITRVLSAFAACAAVVMVVIGGKMMMDGSFLPMKAESAMFAADEALQANGMIEAYKDERAVQTTAAMYGVKTTTAAAAGTVSTRATVLLTTTTRAPMTATRAETATTAAVTAAPEQDSKKTMEEMIDKFPLPAGFTAEDMDFCITASTGFDITGIFPGSSRISYPSLGLDVFIISGENGEVLEDILRDADFNVFAYEGLSKTGMGSGMVLIWQEK